MNAKKLRRVMAAERRTQAALVALGVSDAESTVGVKEQVSKGRGRGYWAPHVGREGGTGSSPRGTAVDAPTAYDANPAAPGTATVSFDRVEEGRVEQAYRITRQALTDAYTLPGLRAHITVGVDPGYDFEEKYKHDRLRIEVDWLNPDDSEAGSLLTEAYLGRTAHFSYLAFDNYDPNTKQPLRGPQVPGRGRSVFQRQLTMLRDAGYTEVEMFNALSVGRYAWALEGVDYLNNETAANTTGLRFGKWLQQKGVPTPTGWPEVPPRPAKLETDADYNAWFDAEKAYGTEVSAKFAGMRAGDLARWQHPQGYKLLGRDVKADDFFIASWPPDMEMAIGKAYMLDKTGHGSWDGKIDLTKWRP